MLPVTIEILYPVGKYPPYARTHRYLICPYLYLDYDLLYTNLCTITTIKLFHSARLFIVGISHFHDGLILFQFDTIAPNLVPSVSNDLVQLSEWEQMKKRYQNQKSICLT